MEQHSSASFDLRLKCPFTMLVSGPSGCGKSSFVRDLLQSNDEIYNKNPGKVYWFYKTHQDMIETMEWTQEITKAIEGMCTMEWIKDNISKQENCTIVIDDMALEATQDTAQIFSVASHHFHLNVIFITQNIFTKNPFFREMSLNSTYLVLFKNVRDKQQITAFAKQFSPGKTQEFAQIYQQATKKAHSYLFLDHHQRTPDEHRIIANYLATDEKPIELFEIAK